MNSNNVCSVRSLYYPTQIAVTQISFPRLAQIIPYIRFYVHSRPIHSLHYSPIAVSGNSLTGYPKSLFSHPKTNQQ